MRLALAVLAMLTGLGHSADLQQLAEAGRSVAASEPTPSGDGHLGNLESGATVQIRFALPATPPTAFLVQLGNVVGFTGRGQSYRLVLRRDSAEGPIVHEGSALTNGDEWNAENRLPIDLTRQVTAADCQRGYLDLYVAPQIEGDGWTLYRHHPHRPITAVVVDDNPEARARLAAESVLRSRGITLIPAPQRLESGAGATVLSARSRIVLPAGASADDHFAAGDLAAVIAERTNLTLVVTAGEPQPGDIALKQVKEPLASGPEAYRVVVGEHIEAVAADAAGLFYAACTIGQLTGPGGALPRVTIEDWPAYPLRGLQYDVARGQTVETGWWEKLIRELARCKLNAIMVYGENDYAFRGFPFLGRAGTFTPEKARHLADFARRYHVQLIPQFEALGHASAVLSSKELEPLREAGGPWVYCTSKQATWDFLDRIFAELVEQFPDSRYLHVGADEFEMAFGKCPDCAAKVARVGLGGLYAEHMNKLNALCRKHGRKMLFWPSHAGPSDDLSYMTIANAASLQRDCIPTEWIYHGPASYPEIARYQDLGFEDVWVSPAVVCFSVIWPDYPTTYRGIRGFLRAGDARGSRGAMTTTWEWMHGALAANSLLGMVYAAECAWSLGQTTTADFERRFAGWYFGVDDPAGESLHQALAVPWPDGASGALLRNQRLLTELAWAAPATVRRLVIKQPQLHDVAPSLAAVEQAIARVDTLQQRAVRNAALLDYARASLQLVRHSLRKIDLLGQAAGSYAMAAKAPAGDSARLERLRETAASIRLTAPEPGLVEVYRRAVRETGAYLGDVTRLETLAAETEAMAASVDALVAAQAGGQVAALPPAREVGLERGRAVKLGDWQPAQMSEQGAVVKLPVTAALVAGRAVQVEWVYRRGSHGVRLAATRLMRGDQVVSEDRHVGWAGAGTRDNVYRINATAIDPAAEYELVGELSSHGGTDSHGEVWLLIEE